MARSTTSRAPGMISKVLLLLAASSAPPTLLLLRLSSIPQVARATTTDTVSTGTATSDEITFDPVECSDDIETCLADSVCATCYAVEEDLGGTDMFTECQEGYLGGSTADAGTCDLLASVYCCSNDLADVDLSCLTDSASLAYWGCVFDSYGCSLEDASCLQIDESVVDDDDAGATATGDDDSGAAMLSRSSTMAALACASGLALAAGVSGI